MSDDDRFDAENSYGECDSCENNIDHLSAVDIMDLFLNINLSDLQNMEMIEALIASVNGNGYKFKLVEEEQ